MLILHTDDEVFVRNIDTDVWEHGIVHEVGLFVAWVSLDDCFIDVPVDPTDTGRIRMHKSTVA